MTRSGVGEDHRAARVTATGAVISAAIVALGTFGAALFTDKSPTTILVEVWSQVTGTGDGGGDPKPKLKPQPGPKAGEVYHTDPLKITYVHDANSYEGVRVDLDASAEDPQWGVVTVADSNRYDLTWWSQDRTSGQGGVPGEGIDFLNAAQGVVLDAAGDSTCQNATGYANHIPYTDLEAGKALCVVTSDKRYALMQITERSADGNTIAFDVKAFKKATDK